MRSGGGRVQLRLLVTLVLASWCMALAQPLAAAGGWARPVEVPTERPAAAVGVRVTTSGSELVWADQQGVWVRPNGGDPTLLAAAQNVRGVSAGDAGGELAVAWAQRDRNTGQYGHFVWRAGQVTELFTDPVEVALDFVTLEGATYVAGTLRRQGNAQLTLLPLSGGAPVVLRTTPLSVRGLTFAAAPTGALWAAWLEGKTERTEFGVNAEWHAFALLVDGSGAALPLDLGNADVTDERQRAVIAAAPGGANVMWSAEDGGLQLASVAGATGTLERGQLVELEETGRPLAGAWPYFYWTEGSSFKRIDASAPQAATATNILWSPVTVEGAAFGHAGAASEPGLAVLAWYGRAQGGGVAIYTADDAEPMPLTPLDRIARLMGWNPWFVAEQAIGQALTALLVGVLGVLAFVPYLLITAPLTARAVSRRARAGKAGLGRGAGAGLIVGAMPLLAASVALALTGVYGHTAPVATVAVVAAALLVGLGVAYLVAGRGDREVQANLLIAAALTVFGSVTVWSFITYPAWAPLVGLT